MLKQKNRAYDYSLHPFLRIDVLDHSIQLANDVRELKAREFCNPKRERTTEEIKKLFPRWNIISNVAWVEPAGYWNRMASLMIDQHLTELILKHRKNLNEEESQLSSPCKELFWTINTLDSGVVNYTPSKSIDWKRKDEKGLILPLSYTEHHNFVKAKVVDGG